MPLLETCPRPPGDRLVALDVLRGLSVAGMVLVTDPGTYSHVFSPLRHSLWEHPTATDMIFPSFLVMVGISLVLSTERRRARGQLARVLALHALRRSALLLVLGLAVNAIGDFSLVHLRFPGILQRIAICYLLAALLYLALAGAPRRRRLGMLASAALAASAIYWVLLKVYPTPGFGPGRLDPLGSLPAVFDRSVFGPHHLWRWGAFGSFGNVYDPEGALSTLGALTTTLCGVFAGEVLLSRVSRVRQALALGAAGVGLVVLGLIAGLWMPQIKKLWTPSFAVESAGIALVAFVVLLGLIDLAGFRRGWTLALIYGTNAIAAFFLSTCITTAMGQVRMAGGARLRDSIYAHGFANWLAPAPASLGYAVLIVLLNAALLYPLYRKKILLRL